MARISEFLIQYPELAVFLAIALGYVIGGIKLGNFSLGPVTGALIAGLAIGQLGEIPVSGMAKSFLFLLFLFGIGYSVGPQFLQAMRRGGAGPIVLAVVCTGTGLLAALVIARILDLDPGFAAGLLSGALTQSAALGTATEAIGALGLPDAQRDALVAHAGIADAICYVFGAVGAIWFLSTIAPRILGIDLAKECAALEAKLGIGRKVPGFQSAYTPVVLRAYVIPEDAACGRPDSRAGGGALPRCTPLHPAYPPRRADHRSQPRAQDRGRRRAGDRRAPPSDHRHRRREGDRGRGRGASRRAVPRARHPPHEQATCRLDAGAGCGEAVGPRNHPAFDPARRPAPSPWRRARPRARRRTVHLRAPGGRRGGIARNRRRDRPLEHHRFRRPRVRGFFWAGLSARCSSSRSAASRS